MAVKILHDDGKNVNEARQSLLQEAAILHQFHHPNYLKILGIVDNPVRDRNILIIGDDFFEIAAVVVLFTDKRRFRNYNQSICSL